MYSGHSWLYRNSNRSTSPSSGFRSSVMITLNMGPKNSHAASQQSDLRPSSGRFMPHNGALICTLVVANPTLRMMVA